MAKNWWFKFDFRVWRTDSELRRCSLETRGFWMETLCAMHEADTFKVEGSYEELGWLIGCSPEVVARCVLELKRTNAANVTLGNGTVTVVSRRLKRELKDREQTRLRVRRHRSNADVTGQSKSNKKEVKKEEEVKNAGKPRSRPAKPSKTHPDFKDLMALHASRIGTVFDGAAQGKAINSLLAHFPADDCRDCYNFQVRQLTSNGGWRDSVSWLTVQKSIGDWVASGKPLIPAEKNGTAKRISDNGGFATHDDRVRSESEEFYSNPDNFS